MPLKVLYSVVLKQNTIIKEKKHIPDNDNIHKRGS